MYFKKMYDLEPQDWKLVAAFVYDNEAEAFYCWDGDKYYDYNRMDITRCDHCNHQIKHFVVMENKDSGDPIVIGWDCYNETFSQSSRVALSLAVAKKRAAANAAHEQKLKQIAEYKADHAELIEFLEKNQYVNFFRSLLENLATWGKLTENQQNKAYQALERSKIERVEEKQKLPAPTGKGTWKFTIGSCRWQENDFGGCMKFRGIHADGWAVWASLPKAIQNAKVGDSVEVTLTLTPSGDDPTFAYGKISGRSHRIL